MFRLSNTTAIAYWFARVLENQIVSWLSQSRFESASSSPSFCYTTSIIKSSRLSTRATCEIPVFFRHIWICYSWYTSLIGPLSTLNNFKPIGFHLSLLKSKTLNTIVLAKSKFTNNIVYFEPHFQLFAAE